MNVEPDLSAEEAAEIDAVIKPYHTICRKDLDRFAVKLGYSQLLIRERMDALGISVDQDTITRKAQRSKRITFWLMFLASFAVFFFLVEQFVTSD